MEELIEKIKQKARDSWRGATGEQQAEKLEQFLRGMLPAYADALGYSQTAILSALEKRRDVDVTNFYQESKYPPVGAFVIYENQAALQQAFPSRKFRCPLCEGVTTDPYECHSGLEMEPGKLCDWKAYGLFKTVGRGLRFTVKDAFLENAIIDEIFLPLELEQVKQA